MKDRLLDFLCDPIDKSPLELHSAVRNSNGDITAGELVSKTAGRRYPIVDGIPRFVEDSDEKKTVDSFGNEWNYFNFDSFKDNWLNHTVKNTFGTPAYFTDKIVVDAGAGSGMQSRWISEAGAAYVIALELSHSVDGVMRANLEDIANVDIVQCSIDHPPLKDGIIDGIVMCHNVIMHTRSVEDTAHALFQTLAEGGEFVFNCYPKNTQGVLRKIRYGLYTRLRAFLSQRSFRFILNYARLMSLLRFIPLVGLLLEKGAFMVRGEVTAKGPGSIRRLYKAGVLNTYDCFGSHSYQHTKTDDEIRILLHALQPDSSKISNIVPYFQRPQPIGCALRVER